ncbi:hypothetical protein KBB96_14225 [Luteolibacter ambystomatis]|uniref:SH3 domain-containing protein n=1 Tax=Luteolibacter ambystomatis TaxID=2824561 RepID=A0A975G827_9BACT|nr:hypothetical protein [Luteolibacter ambystomatis]QUE50020.1 hypothetical protein KBB96_14225 [Luteolibacter ambystomatis]
MNYRLLLPVAAAFSVVSCATLNRPLSSGGDFDPLTAPGSIKKSDPGMSGGGSFSPGQFVTAVTDNTAFFKQRPRGEADADKLLKLGTRMKVVASDGAYLKVELDSGEVGYVASVLVSDPAAPAAGLPGAPGEVQVYPPLGPLKPVDQSLPVIPPGEAPPSGAVPTVIDPAAAPNEVPVPAPTDVKPPSEGTPAAESKPAGETKPPAEAPEKPAGN